MHNNLRFIKKFPVIHLGWKKLQDVDEFVKPEERKDLYPHQALYHIIEERVKKFMHQPD